MAAMQQHPQEIEQRDQGDPTRGEGLRVIRGGARRMTGAGTARSARRRWTSWRRSPSLRPERRQLDDALAEDFIAMPGTHTRPSASWDDQARRPELALWWGPFAFRLDEAVDHGYDEERIVRPVLRLAAYLRARCRARQVRPVPPVARALRRAA